MKDLYGHPPLDPGIESLIPTWEQRGSSFAHPLEISAGIAWASEQGWTLYPDKLRLCLETTLSLWTHQGEDLSHVAWTAVRRHVNETVDRHQNRLRGENYRPDYPERQRRYLATVMWILRQRPRPAATPAQQELPLAAE